MVSLNDRNNAEVPGTRAAYENAKQIQPDRMTYKDLIIMVEDNISRSVNLTNDLNRIRDELFAKQRAHESIVG